MSAPTLPRVVPDPAGVEFCEDWGIDYVRLQGTLEWVQAHPDSHNQGVWARRTECGTAACLAGWTVVLADIALDWDGDGACETADGELISDVAQNLLGLEDYYADWLFGGGNTLDDLWRIAEEITHGAVRRPTPTP